MCWCARWPAPQPLGRCRGPARRPQQRGAGDAADRRSAASPRFDRRPSRGKGGLAPGLVVATDAKGDYGFLDLGADAASTSPTAASRAATRRRRSTPSSTPSAASIAPARRCMLTALLRDARGAAVTGLPLTLVVKRPDGVEYRRAAVDDQGAGRPRAVAAAALGRAARHLARLRPLPIPRGRRSARPPSSSRTIVPERLELDAEAAAGGAASAASRPRSTLPCAISTARPAPDLDGHRRDGAAGGAARRAARARRLRRRPGGRGVRDRSRRSRGRRASPTRRAAPASSLDLPEADSPPAAARPRSRCASASPAAAPSSARVTLPIRPAGAVHRRRRSCSTTQASARAQPPPSTSICRGGGRHRASPARAQAGRCRASTRATSGSTRTAAGTTRR